MSYNPVIAYCIILLLSPAPNIAIISYINKKPLLTKVALDHHHKDMILINWVMSTILISYMILVNLPGFREDYSDTTRKLLEGVIRRGIGVFVLALLTSFLISAAIHYLQKFHWSWMCEHDDENVISVLRIINGLTSLCIWSAWLVFPSKLHIAHNVRMTLVEIYAAVCLFLFLIMHLAIKVRKHFQRRHMEHIYKHLKVDGEEKGKGGALSYITISLSSVLCASTVIMFVILAEKPRSFIGATFPFVLTIAIICPMIFIIGNNKMRNFASNIIKNMALETIAILKEVIFKAFKPSRARIEPIDKGNNVV